MSRHNSDKEADTHRKPIDEGWIGDLEMMVLISSVLITLSVTTGRMMIASPRLGGPMIWSPDPLTSTR
jgi:hypothetical protein